MTKCATHGKTSLLHQPFPLFSYDMLIVKITAGQVEQVRCQVSVLTGGI